MSSVSAPSGGVRLAVRGVPFNGAGLWFAVRGFECFGLGLGLGAGAAVAMGGCNGGMILSERQRAHAAARRRAAR